MVEKIRSTVKRYGCKIVVFDHLHFLVRGNNVQEKIGDVTRTFKMLAGELDIVFILIAQPRKIEGNRAPTPQDLKDSSSIFQDLDSLIILHRRIKNDEVANPDDQKEGKMEKITEVHCISRFGDGGTCTLYFNGRKARFYEKGIAHDKETEKFMAKRKKKLRKRVV